MSLTRTRTIQYIGILLALGLIAVGYWYFSARAGVKQGAPLGGPAPSNLVGYWSFDGDDISGTTAYDRSGSGNNGTLTNGPTKATGKSGQALNFDGTDDHIAMSPGGNMGISGALTVSAWVKPTIHSSYQTIIARDYNASHVNWSLSEDNSNGFLRGVITIAGAEYALTSTTIIPLNIWSQVLLRYDGSTIKLFLNGVEVASTTQAGSISSSSLGLYVGRLYQGGSFYYPFSGSIDEVRIYNAALTAAQIYDLYKLGGETVGASTPTRDSLNEGLAGYWKLDDASGTTATDSSTNGNNGTLTNGPTWAVGQIGGAVDFDGADDRVVMGDVLDVTDGADFTLSGWVYRDASGAQWDSLITKRSSVDIPGYYVDISSDKLRLGVRDTANDSYSLTGTTTLSASTWYHFAAVFDDSSSTITELYINGKSENSTKSGTLGNINDLSNTYSLTLGRNADGTGYLNGKLDEVRIYNRILSAEEVTRLYKTTTPGNPDTRLKGYWSFDGDSISGTTARDLSGTGRNGTLVSSPAGTYGAHGQALNFSGGNYVNTGNYYSYSRGTVALWAKPSFGLSTTNYFHALYSTKNGGCDIFDLQFDTLVNKWGFAVSGTCTYRSVYSPVVTSNNELQRWHYIVGTWDKDRGLRLYVDGVLAAESLATTGVLGHMAPAVGGNVFSNWQGAIDEFRVYDVELSASEIYNLYQEGGVKVNKSQSNNGDSLNSGLLAYWTFDTADISGNTVYDRSGNGYNGTFSGSPGSVAGVIGQGASFLGDSDYMDISSFTSTNKTYTFAFWVNLYASGNYSKYVFDTQSGRFIIDFGAFAPTNGALSFIDASARSIGAALSAGVWHHVVLSLDNTSLIATGYIDGVKAGTAPYSGNINIGGTTRIATDYNGYGAEWDGSLDEFRIYNRVLSDEEITRLYKTTSPTNPETGLVGYWSFNGKDIAGTTAYDRSGKGNNGTLTNGPTKTFGKIGQALTFDGSDDYVSLGTTSSLTNLGAMTFSAWIKPTISGVSEWIIADKGNNTGTGWSLKICSSYGFCGGGWEGLDFWRGFTITNGEWKSTTHSIVSNQWQHVVVTFAGSSSDNPVFYVNGTVSATTELVPPSGSIDDDSATTLRIGRTGSGAPYNGSIDEVRIYNRVLSATEIANLYNFGR